MTATRSTKTVTTVERLREIINAPAPDSGVRRKQLAFIDQHARNFIARSPFALLSTASAAGRCDVSPRGDGPGFVKVLDDMTLIVPDRPGNRRLDSMENIIANPHAGLLFLIPNVEETLRVNGRATITEDRDLLAPMEMKGKAPTLGVIIEVEELFFHCARAFRRAELWQPETWIDRSELPTLGKIMADQLKLGNQMVDEIDAGLDRANKNLY
ncbi:MAG: pyridoxamine 5'-phosphate oxidase family protein [Thermomicrobiales bacterium]